MQYNVDFEIAAIVLLAEIYIFRTKRYSDKIKSNKRFAQFVLIAFVTTIMDVLTALISTYYYDASVTLQYSVNLVYFFFSLIVLYFYFRYISSIMEERGCSTSVILVGMNHVILTAMTVIYLMNYVTGWIFYYEDGHYTRGPYLILSYLPELYFLLISIVLVIKRHHIYTRREWLSVAVFSVFGIMGAAIQAFILPNYLLSYMFATLGIIAMSYALESPDAQSLREKEEEIRVLEQKVKDDYEAKNLFLKNIAYLLRSPINAILGMNTLIQNQSKDQAIVENARSIETAAKNVIETLNDLYDVANLEMGKVELYPVRYQTSVLLTDCINQIKERAKEKGVEVTIQADPTMPRFLYGDVIRVRQILNIMLSNALKFTDKGRISLSVQQNFLESDRVSVVFMVEDSGYGLKKQELERIYDIFSTDKDEKAWFYESAGVNLRIARQLAQRMNGKIDITSEIGKGTTSRVEIVQGISGTDVMGNLLDSFGEKNSSEVGISLNFRCPEAKILVVDDVPLNLKVMVGLLRDTGAQIETVASGREALTKTSEKVYDLIFLDYLMPGMDGLETMQRIKNMSDSLNTKTPMIMITANAEQGARERFMSLGFADYVIKPVQEKRLKELLLMFLPRNIILGHDAAPASEMKRDSASTGSVTTTDHSKATFDQIRQNNLTNGIVIVDGGFPENGDFLPPFPAMAARNTYSPENVQKTVPSTSTFVVSSSSKSDTITVEEGTTNTTEEIKKMSIEEQFPMLNTRQGLEYCGGMDDFYVEMIEEFLDMSEDVELDKALAAKDWAGYRLHAHTLKAAARTIGAVELADLAFILEEAGRESREDIAVENHAKVIAAAKKLSDDLRAALG